MTTRRATIVLATLATLAAAALAACSSGPSTGTTEQLIVYTSPATWDFGAVPLGSAAAPRTIVVGISGSQNESHTINAITENCPDFDVDYSMYTLPFEVYRFCETCGTCAQADALICESETLRFDVSFVPTVAGSQSCTINVEYDTGTKVVTVMGTGDAPEYDLTLLSPPSRTLAFGDVVVGQTSAALTIQLRSDGTMPLDITSATFNGSGDPSQFQVSGDGPGTLSPGATRDIDVSCAPTASGGTSAGFDIVSNDPAEPVITIDFTCNGIQSDLAIDPSPLLFPDTFVGDTVSRAATLTNTGTAPMVVESVSVTPSQFIATMPSDLNIPAGGSIDVGIDFTADESVVDSDVQGQLTVTFDGGQTRSIDVIGPVRSAILSVTPGGEVDFGTVCAGRSERRLFAAINLGSGAFDLAGAAIAGDGFSLTLEPSYPVPLPARGGATAAFEVTAMPPEGDVTGSFTLTPAIASVPPSTITLLAHGQLSGVAANPGAVAFEAVVVNEPSGGRSVRLTNCEAMPLNVTGAVLSGPNAGEFTAVTELALPGSIAAFGSATWLVELTPRSTGDKFATLEIAHDGGVTSVVLTGLGIDDAPEEGRGSYYACSSSRPDSLLLVMLAAVLVFLLPRRRAR